MGSKPSRDSLDNGESLSEQTIAELCEETGFTREELLAWHTNFHKDCPDGKLTLKQFEHSYAKIMGKPTHKTLEYIRHMFNIYDQDNNQFIDFREFTMAISAASTVNRLRLVETLFHVFDLDHDGNITKEELGKMLHTLVDVTETNQRNRLRRHADKTNESKASRGIELERRIDSAFNELNANADDHITKDEFIQWYIRSGLLSEGNSDEIYVPDTARVQQLERKSRTNRNRDQNLNQKNQGQPTTTRYISRMIEKKPRRQTSDSDDDGNDIVTTNPDEQTVESDTSGRENEQWQVLFNVVLSHLRESRPRDEKRTEQEKLEEQKKFFIKWKKAAEESATREYLRQRSTEKSTGPSKTDVVSVRL